MSGASGFNLTDSNLNVRTTTNCIDDNANSGKTDN
jgi:hypothetical protein